MVGRPSFDTGGEAGAHGESFRRKPHIFAVVCGSGSGDVVETACMRPFADVRLGMLVPPGTWAIDPPRSMVGFDIRHLKLTKVRGRFGDVEGVIRCNGTDAVSITGSVGVASIDTGDPRRDARLRDEGFFDVGRYPRIVVEIASPLAAEGEAVTVRGTMTIRGARRPLELHVEGPPTPVNGNGDLRIRARGAVSRRAFGLDWDPAFAAGGLVIDDRIALRLDLVVVPSALASRRGVA